jgi:predicted ArsR family transcriptional regulator
MVKGDEDSGVVVEPNQRVQGAQFKGSKARVLRVLKEQGGATASALADVLGLTRACLHSHLADLSLAGFVRLRKTLPQGRGRPGHVYELTAAGENYFPKDYAQLANDILAGVEELYGEAAIGTIFEARNGAFSKAWKPALKDVAREQKLEFLAEQLSLQGYEAKILSEDGAHFLILGNCPFLAVAEKHMTICHAEQKLHQEVLGVTVVRESRIVEGARSCCYRLLG